MNRITAGMRLSLIGRQDDLKHLLVIGIEDDADWYRAACECFVLLSSIEEDERTPVEIYQRKILLEIIDIHEQEHYRYGN